MINHAAARDEIATMLTAIVPNGTTVYRSGLEPLSTFPAVVIGMPTWSVDESSYFTSRSTMPIAVILAKPNTQDPYTVDVLESLWELITNGLIDASHADQTLGGICHASAVQHTEFGQFNVQGQDYPAQVIFIDLFG